MDPQTILIGAAAFVISAILIYLISAFTMKEKTFEEVIEEQRKRQEEEREKQKNEKKAEKEHKKKYRKGKEKPKDKPDKATSATSSDSEVSKDHKMVNLEIDPEIIEPVESVSLNSKKSKNKKAKSILVNKDEKSVVTETKQAKELYHKEIAPKDEIELHHEQHRGKDKQQADQSSKTSKKHEKSREVERVEKERSVRIEKSTETVVEVQRTRAVVAESEVKSARAKGGVIAADAAALNGSKLIASVKSANLKDSEIQTLIEILLNRQGISTSGAGAASASEWNKKSQKGDPMALLKKQLEEKERALQEEQNIAMSASGRVKEIRQELSTEKAKFSSLEKRYQEKIALQSQEIEALHSRMQNTHQQHMREIEAVQSKVSQLESSGDKNLIQKLQEEKKILTDTLAKSASEKTISPAEMNNLKQKVVIMEKELSSNAIKLNASENAKKNLEQKVAKYEEQLKKHDSEQKDVEIMLNRKMEEVNQELRRAEARNEGLANEKKKATTDFSKATDALNTAQKEVSTLKSKLQELEKHLSASDNTKELEARLQESERKKLDLEGNLKNLEKQLADSKKSRTELETEMQSLRQENFALAEEMKTTKERQAGEGQEAPSAPAGAPNGDVKEQTVDKEQMNIREHEKIVADKLAEISKLSREVESQQKQVSSLQEQLDAQKKKNNDLREKNWKAMEALDKAEKSASVKVDSAVKSTRDKSQALLSETEAQDKGVLQRLFPDVSVSDKLVHKEWISQFEKEASVHITALSSKSSDTSSQDRITDLESANKRLQSEVTEYKQLVTEAESKLKQLEKSVESEEKRWQEQLKQAQSQLKTSSSQVSELEKSLEKHQVETQKIKTTLAETEKRLQESESQRQQQSQTAADTSTLEERCYQLEVRVGELEDTNSQYEKQVQEYRNVLALTEEKLTQLEKAAQSEETKWQEKVKQSEKDLQQSKHEVETLQEQVKKFRGSTEDLSDLSFAYGIVEKSLPRIIEEMEVKVASLESQLKASEDRCLLLQKEAQEAQTQIVTVQTQLETTKLSSEDLEALRRRIAELEGSLEIEKKKTKDLSTNVVKLNGIIKTGQDALKQEQDTVQKLSDQLSALQSSSGGSGKDIQELKAKLADKEKQLEREIGANKQLSQQLAASPGNDMGTSV